MGFFNRKSKAPNGESTLTSTQPSTSFPSLTSSKNKPKRRSGSSGNRSPSPTLHNMTLPRPPDPTLDPAGYLRSLGAVRARSKIIMDKALDNQLTHFDVDMSKMDEVVMFVSRLIKRDYDAPFNSIPGHGRYQHFAVGGKDRIAALLESWPSSIDNHERCRRIIDLFLVSVLLDAGAGTQWGYTSTDNGKVYRRSEGLAVASLDMFNQGLFSGNPDNKFQVDAAGLKALTPEKLAAGLQSKPGNELAGIEGRTDLLIRLARALGDKTEFFGPDARPGGMADYLLQHPSTQHSPTVVSLPVLWCVLMNGLAAIWPPSRTTMDGISLGDAWPCTTMPNSAKWETILPFHKLTQWLTYSLMQPMQSLLNIQFHGTELLTGLPEYRNGGLFVDLGVLTLKKDDMERGMENYSDYCRRKCIKGVEVAPMFEPSDDVIVEWRGATVGLLDLLCVQVNKALVKELDGNVMSLPQLLEAGSWKGGREIAEINRPNTKEPPILIESDGTVF